MKRCMIWVLVLALLAGCLPALGEPAEADGWHFVSESVEYAVREKLNRPEGPITAGELAEIDDLNLVMSDEDLSDLAAMTGLRKLELSPVKAFDATPLLSLTGLESLLICAVEEDMVDLKAIMCMTWLRELELMLRQDYREEELAPLSGMTQLRRLSLYHPRFDVGGGGEIEALPDLSGLTALEELDLAGNSMNDLSGIRGLTGLRRLILEGCYINDLSAVSTLTGLEELNMRHPSCDYWDHGDVDDISMLAGLQNLRRLTLSYQSVEDLSPLAGLTALEELNLNSNPATDLRPLAGLSKLRRLDIGYMPGADLSPLQALEGLESLSVSDRVEMDLSPLAGLARLRELTVNDTREADLSFLAGMAGLRKLTISMGYGLDLSLLAEAKGLEEIYFSYYSLKEEDLAPLAGLPNLRVLELEGTGMDGMTIADLPALADRVKSEAEAPAEDEASVTDEAPAQTEAPAEGEATAVPEDGGVTFTTEITADDYVRWYAGMALNATATVTLTLRERWLPADFQREYGRSYRLRGNEAGVSFDIRLDSCDVTATCSSYRSRTWRSRSGTRMALKSTAFS